MLGHLQKYEGRTISFYLFNYFSMQQNKKICINLQIENHLCGKTLNLLSLKDSIKSQKPTAIVYNLLLWYALQHVDRYKFKNLCRRKCNRLCCYVTYVLFKIQNKFESFKIFQNFYLQNTKKFIIFPFIQKD